MRTNALLVDRQSAHERRQPVGPGHRNLLDFGHESRRIVFAQSCFTEIDDRDRAIIHDLPQVERPIGMTDDAPIRGVGQEHTEFVSYRGDGLGAVFAKSRRQLIYLKRPLDRVVDQRAGTLASGLFAEQDVPQGLLANWGFPASMWPSDWRSEDRTM